jgi:hypothetical protein
VTPSATGRGNGNADGNENENEDEDEDGSVEEMQSGAVEGPCARRRHGHGGRRRVHSRLVDGRLYLYRGAVAHPTRASRNAHPCPRHCHVGSRIGDPCLRPSSVCHHHDCRNRPFSRFPVCRIRPHHSPSFVCHRRDILVAACLAPRLLLAGPWGRRAIPGLGCVWGEWCRRDDCGTRPCHQSCGTF